ncbi:MAG TPA: GNAT family N-acetyltransferase [Jatrophihabitans sp.]
MHTRPATPDDLPQITELTVRSDTAWFGAPEHDESEVGEYLDQVGDLATDSCLFVDGDRLIAAAFRNATDTWYVIDPDAVAGIADELIAWIAGSEDPKTPVLDRDSVLRAALDRHGWTHRSSMFDLLRPVSNDWEIAEPVWPDGVATREFTPEDAEAIHHLIYVEAGWAEVPGHPHRDFADWRPIFVTEHSRPEVQTLAWRGDRLVGVAMGRIFSDGTGWIAQLAVAKPERGQGLGRALLLDGLRRRRDAGATMLGLSVQAANRNALDLYLDAGLVIDREWMEYRPGG